jgi:hypothetical protein
LWDQFDDKAKAIILNTALPQHNTGITPTRTHVNLHDISAYDYLQANMTDIQQDTLSTDNAILDSPDQHGVIDNEEHSDSLLINVAKSAKPSPGDIKRVLSKTSTRSANVTQIIYNISASRTTLCNLSLIDRGANGGIAGDDVRVVFKTDRCVDVRGIDNHQVNGIDIGTVGGVIQTQKGPVVAIMHQYALLGKGSSIHSPCQLEFFKNIVDDKSLLAGGNQCITTLDGYIIPLIVKEGLVRLQIKPYTDKEWDTLPHLFLTGETVWDPTVLDFDRSATTEEQWLDAVSHINTPCPDDINTFHNRYDEFGNYCHTVTVQYASYYHRHSTGSIEDVIDQCVYDAQHSENPIFYDAFEHHVEDIDVFDPDTFTLKIDPRTVATKPPDYELLRPFFGWFSADTIKHTLEHTTQYARLPSGTLLHCTFKSPNPALNVSRRNEPVACDIVYADVPAVDNGSTAAVIFAGLDTQVTDIYGIKTDKSLSTPSKTTSDNGEHLISLSVIVHKLKLATKFLISYVLSALVIGKVNRTSNNKTLLSAVIKLSKLLPIELWIVLVHLLLLGSFVSSTFATCSITPTMSPSKMFPLPL